MWQLIAIKYYIDYFFFFLFYGYYIDYLMEMGWDVIMCLSCVQKVTD